MVIDISGSGNVFKSTVRNSATNPMECYSIRRMQTTISMGWSRMSWEACLIRLPREVRNMQVRWIQLMLSFMRRREDCWIWFLRRSRWMMRGRLLWSMLIGGMSCLLMVMGRIGLNLVSLFFLSWFYHFYIISSIVYTVKGFFSFWRGFVLT